MTPLLLAEWLPSASSVAPRVDRLVFQLLAAGTGMCLLLGVLTVVILVRYRRGSRVPRGPVRIATWKIETAWTSVTLAVFLFFFFEGAGAYSAMERIPPGLPEIDVVGRQWMWDVTHSDGRREFNSIHVRLNQPVRIVLSSEDVVHSFFVPAFRIKQDAVPGRIVSTWFNPTRLGSYPVYCAQYCGTAHAQMLGTIVVMGDSDFEAWNRGGTRVGSAASNGAAAFAKYGCVSCHGASPVRAPELTGLYGTQVTLADGRKVKADETYITDAILRAPDNRVAGYPADMPSYGTTMSPAEAFQLAAYIRSLGHMAQTPPQSR